LLFAVFIVLKYFSDSPVRNYDETKNGTYVKKMYINDYEMEEKIIGFQNAFNAPKVEDRIH